MTSKVVLYNSEHGDLVGLNNGRSLAWFEQGVILTPWFEQGVTPWFENSFFCQLRQNFLQLFFQHQLHQGILGVALVSLLPHTKYELNHSLQMRIFCVAL